MSAIPEKKLMDVDAFLAWAENQPGRFELYHGVVYAMSPERASHARMKHRIARALEDGIRRAGIPCHMLPDGMTVRVDVDSTHEPDALVYCGKELPNSAIEVPNPVIVVEVLSPSTRYIDGSAKLMGYFRLPSVQHYLIVDPDKLPIIQHSRQADGTLLTRIIAEGVIKFDPPGLEIAVVDLFPPEPPAQG